MAVWPLRGRGGGPKVVAGAHVSVAVSNVSLLGSTIALFFFPWVNYCFISLFFSFFFFSFFFFSFFN